MAQFGSDYSPTPAEGFRNAVGLVLIAVFVAGVMFVTSSSTLLERSVGFFASGAMALGMALQWLLSLPRIVRWLEWRRPVKAGEWRTTRAFRAANLFWVLCMSAYGAQIVVGAVEAQARGDLPKLAVAAALITTMAVFVTLIAIRALRGGLELKIDARCVYAHQWRGLVPWEAIDHVLPGRLESDSPRLVLKPEALADLPAPVRRRNGFLDLNLTGTTLTSSAAVEALRAARPDLEIRRSRSAGVVLPVRGATDVVEADL